MTIYTVYRSSILGLAKLAILLFLTIGNPDPASGFNLEGRHLRVCSGQWPPSYFFEPGTEPKKVSGVVYLFLESLSKKSGFSFSTDFLPWRRCLSLMGINPEYVMESGTEYTLVPVVTWNEERAKKIHYTRPFATWKGLYFYRKNQYPSGPKISKASDLSHFSICGRVGYNYEMYGVTKSMVERLSIDINNLVVRLLAGRCNIFLVRDVNVSGQVLTGAPSPFKNKDIAYKEVPGMGRNSYYMMVNKHVPNSEEILAYLNKQIEVAWKSGQMNLYFKKIFGSKLITYGRPDFE